MMNTVSVHEAQSKLRELIQGMSFGEEVIITENDQPIARLVQAAPLPPRRLGTLKGSVRYLAADFDAPLDEFREYMQ